MSRQTGRVRNRRLIHPVLLHGTHGEDASSEVGCVKRTLFGRGEMDARGLAGVRFEW